MKAVTLGMMLCLAACSNEAAAPPIADADAVELRVTSTPTGATITVDGVAAGSAPVSVRVRPGPHRVQAVMSGMYPVEPQRVTAERGGVAQAHFSLVASH